MPQGAVAHSFSFLFRTEMTFEIKLSFCDDVCETLVLYEGNFWGQIRQPLTGR